MRDKNGREESAFEKMLDSAKSETIPLSEPLVTEERAIEIFGEVIRNIQSLDDLKRTRFVLGLLRLAHVRKAVEREYHQELSILEEELSEAQAAQQ